MLQRLTHHPPAWGDYELARQCLTDAAMMQFVERCPDADDVAYVKFMTGADHSMRAFGEVPLRHVYVLTMVRWPDSWWRAWGLSDRVPALLTSGAVTCSDGFGFRAFRCWQARACRGR